MLYKNVDEFRKGTNLGHVELTFTGMDKGSLYYVGNFSDVKIHCTVAESYLGAYDYSPVETIDSLIQSEFIYMTYGGEAILNTH